jgi:hypothetical protein
MYGQPVPSHCVAMRRFPKVIPRPPNIIQAMTMLWMNFSSNAANNSLSNHDGGGFCRHIIDMQAIFLKGSKGSGITSIVQK